MANMVGVGMGKIAFLLLWLSLLSDRGDSTLSETNLMPIMAEMFRRIDQTKLKNQITTINNQRVKAKKGEMAKGHQYSFALHLSRNDCDKGQLGNNIPTDFQDLRNIISGEDVYNKNDLIAALPLHKYKNGKKTGTDHSEYRILTALGQKTKPGCLIVYTFFSPCFTKCLNDNHQANIINLLDNLKNSNQNTEIVLVFSSLFNYDLKVNPKQVIYDNLIKIPVPVYCFYINYGSVTGALFDKNRPMNQHCLSEKT